MSKHQLSRSARRSDRKSSAIGRVAAHFMLSSILATVFSLTFAQANDDYADKTGEKCETCHTKPTFKGVLNDTGEEFKS